MGKANNEILDCTCSAHPQLQIRHLGEGLGALVIRTFILSLVLAYLMSLIDGLHNIGVAPLIFPFTSLGQYQPRLNAAMPTSPLVAGFDNFVFLYNCAFPGASRLGCGIGMIAASFWTLHATPPNCRIQRAGIGIIAGALIGFRLTLMLTSSAVGVLSATAIFSLGMAAYMLCADRRPGIPSLPLVVQGN